MDENFTDSGPVIEIAPYEVLTGAKPADYSAKRAAAIRVLGARYCLANPRYATNKNRPIVVAQPSLIAVRQAAKKAL